jgi:KDO2-lipid IV(A) lauroyltransferase
MPGSNRRLIKKLLDVLTLVCIDTVYIVSMIVPMNVTSFVFGVLGVLVCPFIPETYLANKNIKLSFPEKDFWWRIKVVCEMWFCLGLFAGEYCYSYRLSKSQLNKKVNFASKSALDNIIKNQKKGIGTLIITGHFSNWELAMSYILKNSEDIRVNAVYRVSNNELLEKTIIQPLRKSTNVNLIAKNDNAGLKIVRALKNGEVVVLLADQNDRKKGVLIDFFGREAYTNPAPFDLYKKLNIDLYYAYITRQKNLFKIDVSLEKLKFDRNRIEKIEFLTILNKKFEESIRKKPSQWFWVHDRWKNKN